MIDKKIIIEKESKNDGQSIYLFYDELYSLYVAFGLSAYYSTMAVDPYLTFSDELDMPVAMFSRGHIRIMRQSLSKVEHTPGSTYQFQTRIPLGRAGYNKWKSEVKKRHESLT